MFKSFSNKAIATKARAMYGSRLTRSDYTELMKRTTVPEVAVYLRDSTHYRDILDKVEVAAIHRGQLESLLRKERYNRYLRLIRYDFTRGAGFYQYLFLWDEIEQIINLLRYIGAGSEGEYHVHGGDIPYCSYNMDALLHARTHEAVLAALRGTDYYKLLRRHPIRETESKNKLDLVAIERDLTTYYFNRVFAAIDKEFDRGAARELREVFLWRIDADNIANAYRLRRFFKSSPEYIQASLLPFRTPSHKLIQRIIHGSAGDLDQILRGSRMGADASDDEMEFIESLTLRLRDKYTKKLLRYSTHAPVTLVAYVSQMEVELANIINIVEAIRYQLAPSDISKMLIL